MARADVEGLKVVLDAASDGRSVEITEMGPYMLAKGQAGLERSAKLQAEKLGQDIIPKEALARIKARSAPCGTVEEFVEQLAAKSDACVRRVYFQTLVPENREMTELLADTVKTRL